MAQITEVHLIDDLDKSEAAETVEFGLDGKLYEIDLSTEHAIALRENLADYVAAARPVRGKTADVAPTRTRRPASGKATVDREQTAAIREWARQNGHTVSDRGRVPNAVLRAFEAAH